MIKLKKNDLRNITLVLIGAAVVLFGFSYYLKLRDDSKNPSKLFWAAVENALSADSLSRGNTSGGDGGEKIRQLTQIKYGNEPATKNVVIVYAGEAVETTTMTIGTPRSDYLSYTNTPLAEIKGKWAKLPLEEGADGRFLVEAVTQSLVLSGKLSNSQRSDFIQMLKDTGVYTPRESRKETRDGVPMTVISVRVDIGSFTAAQAKLLEKLGLNYAAENLTGTDQSGTVDAEFAVLSSTKRFMLAGIPNIDAVNREEFSWNIKTDIQIPEVNISYDDLQKALSGGENASGN